MNKLPALFGQEGETSLLLRNNEWNHVVWEIGNVEREKVTSLEISYYLSGNEPEASDTANYYFDHLELQRVDPDHIEGWDVWPGRISYSHTGYQSGAPKTAIANGLEVSVFRVIDEQTGETVLSKPLRTVETHLGTYQVMDFSELREAGTYIIDAGGIRSHPFVIDPNVWRNTILKALNFFYVERCGTTIPGVHGACHRDWTCIQGDKKIVINGGWHDDLTSKASNRPMDHFVASAAEAIAYRLLQQTDPRMAALSLEMAEEDWQYAVDGMVTAKEVPDENIFRGTFDSDNVEHEVPAIGIIAALDLWKVTGKQRYIEHASEWATIILNSQQRTLPDSKVPITGFFYTSQQKEHILQYCHHGREHTPIMALAKLCEALPDHPDWMKWYSAISLHSQYLKNISKYTEPYGVIPASIYSDQEYLLAPESRRDSFRKQVLNGIPLGGGHYLRMFPVWMDYRGHFGTILPQAKALACAANLRGDLASAQLAQHQLEWVIGRNPFSQSSMWGEGYDFPPLYTPLSGDMVGGLPVGIQTRGSDDIPYWPVQNSWTYKEIWSFPVISWISLMRNFSGPAMVEGFAETNVEFKEVSSEQIIKVRRGPLNGRFKVMLPQGNYMVRSGKTEVHQIFLPASNYHLDLRPGKTTDLEISQTTSEKGEVSVLLTVHGSGRHRFTIRTDNITFDRPEQELDLRHGIAGTLEWRGHVSSKKTPWVAVVVPDGNLSLRKEIRGSVREND